MTIYADTSFVLAAHLEHDINHRPALAALKKFDGHDWLWCELHDVELYSTARTLTRRVDSPLPVPAARAAIFRIERLVSRKVFQRRELPLTESVARAKSLSESYGWLRKHTALDVWHVAAAWCFGANRFATFDERQAELAEDAGLILA